MSEEWIIECQNEEFWRYVPFQPPSFCGGGGVAVEVQSELLTGKVRNAHSVEIENKHFVERMKERYFAERVE